MIRTFIWLAFFWGYQLVVSPILLLFLAMDAAGLAPRLRLRTTQVLSRIWGRILLATTGARIRVTGREHVPPRRSFVVMANHQGTFDIPLLLAHLGRPVAFIAKKELRKLPGVSQWMGMMGCEFLDREDRRQAMQVQKRSTGKLASGLPMVVFPEGTRTGDPDMSAFKPGAMRIAIDAQVPILPVSLLNTWSMFEANNRRLKPGTLELVIHPIIETEGLTKADQPELARRVREAITGPLKAAPPGAAGELSTRRARAEAGTE